MSTRGERAQAAATERFSDAVRAHEEARARHDVWQSYTAAAWADVQRTASDVRKADEELVAMERGGR